MNIWYLYFVNTSHCKSNLRVTSDTLGYGGARPGVLSGHFTVIAKVLVLVLFVVLAASWVGHVLAFGTCNKMIH